MLIRASARSSKIQLVFSFSADLRTDNHFDMFDQCDSADRARADMQRAINYVCMRSQFCWCPHKKTARTTKQTPLRYCHRARGAHKIVSERSRTKIALFAANHTAHIGCCQRILFFFIFFIYFHLFALGQNARVRARANVQTQRRFRNTDNAAPRSAQKIYIYIEWHHVAIVVVVWPKMFEYKPQQQQQQQSDNKKYI